MKARKIWVVMALLFTLITLDAFAGVQITSGGLTSLPREDRHNLSLQGENWRPAAENAMTLLRTGSTGSVGDPAKPYQLVHRTNHLGDYSGMIVTATVAESGNPMQSWMATWQPFGTTPKEFGNRYHLPVRITATEGSTFVPSEISYHARSEVIKNGVYTPDGVIDFTVPTSTDLNYFRLIYTNGPDGTPGTDDDIPGDEDPNKATTVFYYGGPGLGLIPGGSGSAQDKINRTLRYAQTNRMRIVFQVFVPFTDGAGNRSVATETFIFGPDPERPAKPAPFSAQGTSSSEISLQWGDVLDEEGFEIEMNGSVLTTTGKNVTTYTVTGLQEGSLNIFRLRAFNSAGYSDYAGPVSARTQVEPLQAPQGFTAIAIDTEKVRLMWNDGSGETGYKIEQKNGESWAHLVTTTMNATSFDVLGLKPSTQYEFRISAVNEATQSPFSNSSVSTPAIPPLNPPVGFAHEIINPTTVRLSWMDVSGAHGYELEQDGAIIASLSPSTTEYTVQVTPETVYTFRVRATRPDNQGGPSGFTSPIVVKTVQPLVAPTGLVATDPQKNSITLNWVDTNTAEAATEIQQSLDGVAWVNIPQVGANVTTKVVTGLIPDTTYWFRIRTINSNSQSPYTASVSSKTIEDGLKAPANFRGEAISTTRIRLRWNAVEGAIGYRLGIAMPNGVTTPLAEVGNVTEYFVNGLKPNTTYTFTILAVGDNTRKSPTSGPITIRTFVPWTMVPDRKTPDGIEYIITGETFSVSQLETSTDLLSWAKVHNASVLATGSGSPPNTWRIVIPVNQGEVRRFFRLRFPE